MENACMHLAAVLLVCLPVIITAFVGHYLWIKREKTKPLRLMHMWA